MPWKPGVPKAQRALEDPYEDVPIHLAQPLWDWIDEGFLSYSGAYDTDRLRDLAIHLRMPLRGNGRDQMRTLRTAGNEDNEFMLTIAEAMLELWEWDDRRSLQLKSLLAQVNSAYTVNDHSSGLEEVVAPGVKLQVQAVVASATGSAGDHLANSWNEAYGRLHDPVKSYSESIKAVECALAPLISPQNAAQTLGTMIRDVAAKPSKWKFAIADGNVGGVETVLQMMRMLWDGQTSRHGGVNPTRPETLDEARAAVHLAVTLVQYGISGAFAVV